METRGSALPLASHPPSPADLVRRTPRELAKRTPRSTPQDARPARNITPAAGREAAAGGPRGGRTARQPAGASRPLVPASERKSQEENIHIWRIRRDGDGERGDITPDGGSAGREGRQFTVANVGNNGRIYLKPTIRPAHQRPPQPHFVFPITPPSTAGLDALVNDMRPNEPSNEGFGRLWESTAVPSHGPRHRQMSSAGPPNRRRALSDSTLREAAGSAVRELGDGAFRVVISKPAEEARPKTTEDVDNEKPPVLDVTIPSWKIGSPRFSVRGSPMIRGSSHAPTDEFRSSHASFLNITHPGPSSGAPSPFSSSRPSRRSAPSMQLSPNLPAPSPVPIRTPELALPIRSTYVSTHLVIEPAMFDNLTFKPACDDRAIVRHSPTTGTVTAATPSRLVSEITSPSFLDYELISDFFLTYRAFLEPTDLVRMLFARLRWAIERNDEIGMVVRVRTFVALRHWILNYFMDDFVVEYSLRVTFCDLLNDLMDELYHGDQSGKVHLKILSELKKCWRRVCAQFWDGLEFDASLGGDVPITPGGASGHGYPGLGSSHSGTSDLGLPSLDTSVVHTSDINEHDFCTTPRAGDTFVVSDRPGTPDDQAEIAADLERRQQASPTSFMSIDVVSCSFPAKSVRNLHWGPNVAHPVPASPSHAHNRMVAITPKAVVGKRVRPTHRRNGSMSDSLREHSIDRMISNDVGDVTLSVPYAGSLVRGDLLPPGQAFVDVTSPSSFGGPHWDTAWLQSGLDQAQKVRPSASAMSGQGMRRLVGSVRRALGPRGHATSPTQGNFFNISPLGPRGATTNRLPGTAIVPQARPRHNGSRPPVRIDLLGAEIAQDFNKAVREGAAAEAAAEEATHRALLHRDSTTQAASSEGGLKYSAAYLDSSFESLPKMSGFGFGPASEMAITTGSKSIVIVDDTAPDIPAMTGALPAVNPSLEAFANAFMGNGGDPTPPTTPPGQDMGSPRRSSYLFNQHLARVSMSSDPLPPFIPDLATLGGGRSSCCDRHSHVASYPSGDQSLYGGLRYSHTTVPHLRSTRLHNRQESKRTIPSLSSVLHRRATSFNNGTRPPTVRSFDATTFSGDSVADSTEVAPAPLRVLRRRPGGDLGAATTVGELKAAPLRHSRSVGSLTAYSESLRSSYIMPRRDSSGFVDIVSSDFTYDNAETFSLGALAEKPNRRRLSLFSTHSSKPAMRASFEAEARKLAQIPDDAEDEGGVEAALLKLEGKFERKSAKTTPEPREPPLPDYDAPGLTIGGPASVDLEERWGLEAGSGDDSFMHYRRSGVPQPSSEVYGTLQMPPATDAHSFLSTEQSYCCLPLLEWGLSDDGQKKGQPSQGWAELSILRGSDEESPDMTERADNSLGSTRRPSFDLVEESESVRMARGEEDMTQAGDESEEQSFLEDDSGDDEGGGSDLSSELSAEDPDMDFYDMGVPALASPRRGFVMKSPSHGAMNRGRGPPSPPMTLSQALQMSPEAANIPQLHEHQLFSQQKPLPLPPTPDATPTSAHRPESPSRDRTGTVSALRGAPKMSDPEFGRRYSVHLPFILAFDSDILAQQFTLIEKDALNEIDWKELIDMEWRNATNGDSRSWVDFLRNTDARGVEVVIARFNIMAKWAVSEIVLTQDAGERARCLVKFVHIAAHCRRYRNFATMAQIAIALSSQEVARLSRTWALVPAGDLATFRALERLVSPTRNFYALRAEMEGGSGTGSGRGRGCIPFVGIYTHDLVFNAQRPSEIAGSPTSAPLVNFERCRAAAAVVKTLLRLLEESGGYDFQPVEGITERCLWMSALGDEEIRRLSESLE